MRIGLVANPNPKHAIFKNSYTILKDLHNFDADKDPSSSAFKFNSFYDRVESGKKGLQIRSFFTNPDRIF